MKKLVLIVLFLTSLFAQNIKQPTAQYIADGSVIDLVYDDSKLYASTNASVVDIFDVKTKEIVKRIKVSQIKDFMGDTIDAKIYSVDVLKSKILILSQAEHGFREVYIFEDDKLHKLISKDDKLYIAKAKFIDENTLLLGLLSNDIISYDIKNKKQNWNIQASQSKFSNFVFNEDKKEVVVCDESGDLHILDTKNGKNIKTLSGENLDNVFQVDYKNGIIATAGQDRRAVIYKTKLGTAYYKTTHFLIYSIGLSPSGKLAGYASDENNNVTVFKTNTKSKVGVFGGNKMTLTNILFLNENEFFVASDDKTINFYKIK
ncbi:MAG: WD40 repeat domain-containing protein [Epsilonproteobacteria bacterium]|nr:WD40 repeat domain-containing protein [Campylobacterota bacterium]